MKKVSLFLFFNIPFLRLVRGQIDKELLSTKVNVSLQVMRKLSNYAHPGWLPCLFVHCPSTSSTYLRKPETLPAHCRSKLFVVDGSKKPRCSVGYTTRSLVPLKLLPFVIDLTNSQRGRSGVCGRSIPLSCKKSGQLWLRARKQFADGRNNFKQIFRYDGRSRAWWDCVGNPLHLCCLPPAKGPGWGRWGFLFLKYNSEARQHAFARAFVEI